MRWTGRELRLLRDALRMSVRTFAAHTNLSASRIAEIETEGARAKLRNSTQEILDRVLAAAPEDARQRFRATLGVPPVHDRVAGGGVSLATIMSGSSGNGGCETDRREALTAALGLTGAALVGVSQPGTNAISLLSRLPLDHEELDGAGDGVAAYGAMARHLWQLYWSAPAAPLFETAYAHLRLGADLVQHATGGNRGRLMGALSLSALLAARLAFFDLNRRGAAARCHRVALAAAEEADDHLLAAVVLGHMAFEPVFAGDSPQATALIDAGHASARGSSLVRSWLHCVASEARGRAGDGAGSLREIESAEATYAADEPVPDWFDFYDLSRLHCFGGYAATVAGDRDLAVDRLTRAVDALGDGGLKQRSVVCADLAAACENDGDLLAHHLHRAVDALEVSWYGTGGQRVRQVLPLLADSQLRLGLDERLAAVAPQRSTGVVLADQAG